MNIYQKLQKCRVELQNSNLKKSGNNKFAGYDYFELGDFLPKINELMMENGLASSICFMNDIAILRIIDADKPEDSIEFTSPIANAQLKGCHDIQNLGAVQTYLRRYLWTNAMEIVEHDPLDATTGKTDKNEEEKKDYRQEIGKMLMELAGGDKDKASELLKQFTSFTGKDGNVIVGKSSIKDLSDKMLPPTYGKIKAEWLKRGGKDGN